MHHRAIISLVAALGLPLGLTLGLTACAHQAAPVAPAPEMAWSLNDVEGEGLKLAFGQPYSDNVVLMLACEPRSGQVRVSAIAPQGSAARALKLSSGRRSSQLSGEPTPSGMGDGALVEAEARADDPVMALFAEGGELVVTVGARRTELPADPAKSRRFVETCRAA